MEKLINIEESRLGGHKYMALTFPDNKLRLEMKKLADETRLEWARKGIEDIMLILDSTALLIRSSLENTELSGFSTFFDSVFVVFLNSSFSLGHERFTAAHELYHLCYDKEVIKTKKIIIDKNDENEEKAQIFAAEFLMPEEGVRELFIKRVNIPSNKMEPKHIVRLQNVFKVSYAAMLKRLIILGICDKNRYDYLRSFGSIEKSEELIKITQQEGFDTSLITPSKIKSISDEFIEMARSNYENGKIAYDKLDELLDFIGKKSLDYGYIKNHD